MECFQPQIRNKAKMSFLTTHIQQFQPVSEERKKRKYTDWKERKPSTVTDPKISYVENIKESTPPKQNKTIQNKQKKTPS